MTDVLTEMENKSGTHFDPDLVTALLKLAPRLTAELDASLARETTSSLVPPATA